MLVFEQKLFLILESLRAASPCTLHRPIIVLRDDVFLVISQSILKPTDIIVCDLSKKDLSDGLNSSTWSAIEGFIRLNFDWQKTVTE